MKSDQDDKSLDVRAQSGRTSVGAEKETLRETGETLKWWSAPGLGIITSYYTHFQMKEWEPVDRSYKEKKSVLRNFSKKMIQTGAATIGMDCLCVAM